MRILSIGNSFSTDATFYVHEIARGEGVDIETTNLYIGGCTLEAHWRHMISNGPVYIKEVNGTAKDGYFSLLNVIAEEKWDYITLQQASHKSTDYSTYQPFLNRLCEKIKEKSPQSELVIHQTWAYKEGSERLCSLMGYSSKKEMQDDIINAYKLAINETGISKMIPCGRVFQEIWEAGLKGLHRDDFHASMLIGRYFLGCIWYLYFIGNFWNLEGYCPEGLDIEMQKWIRSYCARAV